MTFLQGLPVEWMITLSYCPWNHTHTATLNGVQTRLSVEPEPVREPTKRFFYREGEREPAWVQDVASGESRRVGVADVEDENPHGVVVSVC